MKKRDNERRHARRRAAERYGIEVGKATRQEIVSAIQSGRAKLIHKRSHRAGTWDVVLSDGLIVRVVYDSRTHEPVTFLDRD
jgi:hypothetical protein